MSALLGIEWWRSDADCLLGGTVESQREFIESLSNNDLRRNFDRGNKIPPVANQFALGYTYYDLLDADHEGRLDSRSKYPQAVY